MWTLGTKPWSAAREQMLLTAKPQQPYRFICIILNYVNTSYLGVGVCTGVQDPTEDRCIGSPGAVTTDSCTQVLGIKFRSTTRAIYAPNHLATSPSHAFVFSKQNIFSFLLNKTKNSYLHMSFLNIVLLPMFLTLKMIASNIMKTTPM